jgi:hypothetical protein
MDAAVPHVVHVCSTPTRRHGSFTNHRAIHTAVGFVVGKTGMIANIKESTRVCGAIKHAAYAANYYCREGLQLHHVQVNTQRSGTARLLPQR